MNDLSAWCLDKNSAPITREPYSHNGVSIATDARAIIVAPHCGYPKYGYSIELDSLIDEIHAWDENMGARLSSIHLRFPDSDRCEECDGTGKIEVCEECDGEGSLTFETERYEYYPVCRMCDGSGVMDKKRCDVCLGDKLEYGCDKRGYEKFMQVCGVIVNPVYIRRLLCFDHAVVFAKSDRRKLYFRAPGDISGVIMGIE